MEEETKPNEKEVRAATMYVPTNSVGIVRVLFIAWNSISDIS